MDDSKPGLLRPRPARFDISPFFKSEEEDHKHEALEPAIKKQDRISCPYISTIKRHLLDFDF